MTSLNHAATSSSGSSSISHNHPQQQQQQQQPQQQQPVLPKPLTSKEKKNAKNLNKLLAKCAAGNSKNVLGEASVLADSFVPHALRAVHLQPVTNALMADELPSLTDVLTTTLHDGLVPFIPQCFCHPSAHSSAHNSTTSTSTSISPPRVIHMAPELRFALQQLNSTNTTNTAQIIPVSTPRHVDSISDQIEYGQVFDELLLVERQEVLRLYEHYSQYNIHIQATPSIICPSSGTANTMPAATSTQPSTLSTAILNVKGLVDAQPSLKVGDIVLFRPVHPIGGFPAGQQPQPLPPPLQQAYPPPQPPTQHQPYPPPPPLQPPHPAMWNQPSSGNFSPFYPNRLPPLQPHHPQALYHPPPPPYHRRASYQQQTTVEIYCHIRQTIRAAPAISANTKGRRKPMDKIITTWLDEPNHYWLEQQYYDITNQPFHVRFVPSTKFYERCKTAIEWITTHIPLGMFMELLFPNRAPIIRKSPLTAYDEDSHEFQSKMLSLSLQAEHHQPHELNDKQTNFVRMVMKRTLHPSLDAVRPPMVLTGPAGTGKTKTLLAAIRQVLQLNNKKISHPVDSCGNSNQPQPNTQYRILVCTPSHTAADVVTSRLAEWLNPSQLFRLYDSDRPVETVPIHILPFAFQSVDTGAFSVPLAPTLLQYSVIVCTCSDAHLLYQAGCTNELLRIRRRCFQQYLQVVLSQCQLLGNQNKGKDESLLFSSSASFHLPGVDQPHFTHLFVDEAAQATEPEILIPFSVVIDPLLGAPKVEIALVGDPRQLSPNVFSNTATRAGFGRSLLERLLLRPVHCLGGGSPEMLGNEPKNMEEYILYSLHDQLSVFLTLNYRGHPAFLMMPSALFYFDRLQSDKGVESSGKWCDVLRHVEALSAVVDCSTWPEDLRLIKGCRQWNWPVHFRGVIGQDVSVTIDSSFVGTNSWSNVAEARVVVDIVTTLTQQKVSSESIGIMAPFRGQVVTIRKLLRQIKLGGINVGTVEDFQAVERDVMILSLTRSTHSFVEHDMGQRMGIFGHTKRSNVALTRAEHLFCVVGNPNIMWKDPTWKQWLLFCLRNGFWYGDGLDMESLGDAQTALPAPAPSTVFNFKATSKDLSNAVCNGTRLACSNGFNGTRQEHDDVAIVSTMEKICR